MQNLKEIEPFLQILQWMKDCQKEFWEKQTEREKNLYISTRSLPPNDPQSISISLNEIMLLFVSFSSLPSQF